MAVTKEAEKLLDTVRIQTDGRGAIYEILFGGKQFHLIATKAGILRGGDFHDSVSGVIMLSGTGTWFIKEGNGIVEKPQKENELLNIPPKISHYFKAETNCLFIEWLEQEGPFISNIDPELRKIVLDSKRK